MALNGLQIQKLLPKTNCKECGSSTCLAFAMKLAAKKANLSECPYASEEAKSVLGADSEPPVKSLTIGSEISTKLGAETVLFRHEKTFVNQTAIAINVDDNDGDIAKKLNEIKDYKLERVGEILTINAVSVTNKSGNADTFLNSVKLAYEVTGLPIILNSTDVKALQMASSSIKGLSLIHI